MSEDNLFATPDDDDVLDSVNSRMVSIPRAEYELLLQKQKNPAIVLSGKHIKEFTVCLSEYPEEGYIPIGSEINQENK